MIKLRQDRITTAQGGYGMNIQLPVMRNTPAVFWSKRGNSYVIREDLKIVSINGIGEIRWTVEEWNRDECSNAAREYFLEVE